MSKKIGPKKKLAYKMTYEEAKEHSRQAVKDHFKPNEPEKRVPLDALLALKLYDSLSDGAQRMVKPPSDFDRTLIKIHQKQKKCGKTVPQLGTTQKILEPLWVQMDKEKDAMEFLQEMGLTYAQAAGQTDDLPIAEVVNVPYEFGKPLVTEDEKINLGMQMYKFHKWYRQISKKRPNAHVWS